MCLARAYVLPASPAGEFAGPDETERGPGGVAGAHETGRLIMENVTQVVVDDGHLQLRSLFGEVETLRARIASVDFSEGRLVLESTEA
jgi:predicted RNA-binding protein